MSAKLKSVIQYTIIGLIGVLFLYFVFKGTNWADLMLKFKQTNYWWIAAGMSVSVISHYIRAYRANMLYKALDYTVSGKNSFYAVMIGYMMNYIIPRAGEVSRCASLLKTNDIPVNKSLGTVVTERIFDVVILFILLLVVFFIQFELLRNFILNSITNGNQTPADNNLKYVLLGIIFAIGAILFLMRKQIQCN